MNLSLSDIFGENISEEEANASLPLARDRCEGPVLGKTYSMCLSQHDQPPLFCCRGVLSFSHQVTKSHVPQP